MTTSHVIVNGHAVGVGVGGLVHEPPRLRCQHGSGRAVKSCRLDADGVYAAPVSRVALALCSGHLMIIR